MSQAKCYEMVMNSGYKGKKASWRKLR